MSWRVFYESYLATYIEKDIRAEGHIKEEHSFVTFLKQLAAMTGQLLNYSSLAKDSGVSVNTAKSWVSLLESTGLVYLLYPYSNNLTRRVIKTPKIYFFDTGLASFLTGQDNPAILQNGILSGHIFETYVVTEIIKSYWHHGVKPGFYFYRDKAGNEIDLIIEAEDTLYPIEVKRSGNPVRDDAKHFPLIKNLGHPVGLGAVVCLVPSTVPLGEGAVAVPLSAI
jgi:predicted AAA+ superfamily ATPase